MAVEILHHSDDKIYVNNKLVYKDSSGSWIAKIELTIKEQETLNKHLTTLE